MRLKPCPYRRRSPKPGHYRCDQERIANRHVPDWFCRRCTTELRHLGYCDPKDKRNTPLGEKKLNRFALPMLPCIHRGQVIDHATCTECTGEKLVPIHACPKHERCNDDRVIPGTTTCRDCHDRSSYTGPFRRNLIFHLWPVAEHQTWRWHAEQLAQRIHLFDHRRVMAVALDKTTAAREEVEQLYGRLFQQIIWVDNNTQRREVETFKLLFKAVESQSLDEITFYAHGKGVRTELSKNWTVRLWSETMYRLCLDRIEEAEALLRDKPICGCFKKHGRLFAKSASDWHFSGTFFWFRNAEVFRRQWQIIDKKWFGMESWPSMHFAPSQAGCLFHEGGAEMDLYQESYWRDRLLADLQRMESCR